MPTLKQVIPLGEIPQGLTPWGDDAHWLMSDNKKTYRKRGGHPVYGEKDIVYRHNRHGYRSAELDATGDIRMISIGDEDTLGIGLAEHHTYPFVIADRIQTHLGKSVVHWNLSSLGVSGDYVARLLHLAVPRLRPDVVLVKFPPIGRREFMTAHGHLLTYVPGVEAWDPVTRDVFNNFKLLESENDDQFSLYRNYKSIETALYDCEWVYMLANPSEVTFAEPHLDQRRRVPYTAEWLDSARHDGSPGPKTHELIADLHWQTMLESGVLDRIGKAAGARVMAGSAIG